MHRGIPLLVLDHLLLRLSFLFLFFFNDTATTAIYTLSLHDALPISTRVARPEPLMRTEIREIRFYGAADARSEEHTSELQSRENLVCRLLLEKKKKKKMTRQWRKAAP